MNLLTMERALRLAPGTKLLVVDSYENNGKIATYIGCYPYNNLTILVSIDGKETFYYPRRFESPQPCDWWDIWMGDD
jgi:hypothetical protein